MREKIGSQRQMTTREIKRVSRAIAVRIRKRLQEYRIDAHISDAIEQESDILCLLLGIWIVDIVEVYVHDSQWHGAHLRRQCGCKLGHVGVVAHEIAAYTHEGHIRHIETLVE